MSTTVHLITCTVIFSLLGLLQIYLSGWIPPFLRHPRKYRIKTQWSDLFRQTRYIPQYNDGLWWRSWSSMDDEWDTANIEAAYTLINKDREEEKEKWEGIQIYNA